MSSGIEWQHPNCQFNVKIQFYPQGGRVATGEDTLPADSWPHDSSSSTFWEYEMVQRVWSQNMEYNDAGCYCYCVIFPCILSVQCAQSHTPRHQLDNYLEDRSMTRRLPAL